MGNNITFGRCRFVFPSNRELCITSIGWVNSMTLGFVLIILSFLHQLVMLPVPMEPLLMPHVSQNCPSLHVESMLATSVTIFLMLLFEGSFSLSRPLLSYLVFACRSFPIQLLVHAHIAHLISSKLSSVFEYLVLVDGGCFNSLL